MGGGPNIGLDHFIHFCQSGSSFLLRHSYISSTSGCTGLCSLCCSHSTRDGSPLSPGSFSQASAVIADILAVWGFFRAPRSDFSIEASSSFDKALMFISPICMVSVG